MTAMSNYLENKLLDHAVGTASFTAPSTVYVQLHTGDPGEDGTANVAGETTRRPTGAFSAAAAGTTDNDAAITWTAVSTTETYTHISMWDASSAGNCLFVGALTSSVAVIALDNFQINAGDLDITFD